jgi:hypothetical protein
MSDEIQMAKGGEYIPCVSDTNGPSTVTTTTAMMEDILEREQVSDDDDSPVLRRETKQEGQDRDRDKCERKRGKNGMKCAGRARGYISYFKRSLKSVEGRTELIPRVPTEMA